MEICNKKVTKYKALRVEPKTHDIAIKNAKNNGMTIKGYIHKLVLKNAI